MTTKDGQTSELLKLLRPFAPWIILSVVAGVGAGAATVALLATINSILNSPGGMTEDLLWPFITLCVLALTGRAVSDMSTNFVGQRLVAQVRKMLARKILAAPIDALERYRTHRLTPVLTQDVDMISDVAFTLAASIVALSVAIGCLGYLAWLSLPLFGWLAGALVIGAAVQTHTQARGIEGFWMAREYEEGLHKAYRGISEGAKELRMHRARRVNVLRTQIDSVVDSIQAINRKAINTYVFATAFGSALFFLLIALVLTWAAVVRPPQGIVSGFVLVLLFLKGPIDQIVGALPGVGRAKVAFERIADLSKLFANPEIDAGRDPVALTGTLSQLLEMRGVRYAFPAPDGQPAFTMGPIDVTFRAGEISFIVGDNGSGKTTLIKLLLGLYAPQDGEICWDGRPVTADNRDDYRQLFSTVFSDFYLFEDLFAGENVEGHVLPDTAFPYLQRLEIAHKVSVEDGSFSTVDLSTGQRKRLALVHAYIEGRPVLVFDEWAADQDPAFRHLFYTQLLPELRDKGHLVIAISHDDRYFHVADRVLQISGGKVVGDHRQELRAA
jgi:putative ATP-binding cassette transporter